MVVMWWGVKGEGGERRTAAAYGFLGGRGLTSDRRAGVGLPVIPYSPPVPAAKRYHLVGHNIAS